MSNINWAYVAGFFDGDGSLTLVRTSGANNNCWRARLHQGSLPVLEEMKRFLESRNILSHIQKTFSKGKSPKYSPYKSNTDMYALQVSTRREHVIPFLEAMLPYLFVKKVLVQDVLRLLKIYPKLHRMTHKLGDFVGKASRVDTNVPA